MFVGECVRGRERERESRGEGGEGGEQVKNEVRGVCARVERRSYHDTVTVRRGVAMLNKGVSKELPCHKGVSMVQGS